MCSVCGDIYDAGTGLFEINGKYYYAIAGNLVSGWQEIDGNWYYFNEITYASACGNVTLNSITFEFEENGKLIHGVWESTDTGKRYYYGPDYYRAVNYANVKLAEIDGKIYGFDRTGNIVTGLKVVVLTSNVPSRWCNFDDNGVLISTVNGIYKDTDGKTYYLEDGYRVKKGAVKVGDDIYYFGMNYYALADGTYYIVESMMNGLLPEGTYQIVDSKIVIRNGIYEENGKLYYFENNSKVKKGAVKVGDDIYYFGMNYYALPNGTYYIVESMMNGLLPEGIYQIVDSKIVIDN